MINTYRPDAVVLLVSPVLSTMGVYAPRDLIKLSDLIGLSYRIGLEWMQTNGWEVIDPNGQYAHPVHNNRSWWIYEKHFFVPKAVKIATLKGQFALQSYPSHRYLDNEDLFTALSRDVTSIRHFETEESARLNIIRLGLTEVK